MNFNKTTLLGFLFLSVISVPALAIDSIHIECQSCQTDSQFSAAVKSNAILNKTLYINIMNFADYEIRKFKTSKSSYVECEYNSESDGEGGKMEICRTRYSYSVISTSLTSAEYTNFDIAAQAMNDARIYYFQRSTEIPATIVESGYELIGASYVDSKLMVYFNDLPLKDVIIKKAQAAAASLTNLISVGVQVAMPTLVFEFSDYTKAYAVYDFDDNDGTIHFKFIKLIDKNGNEFDLDGSSPFSGKFYNFEGISTSSWSSFFTALNAYGLTVQGASTKIIPSGTVTIITCSGGTAGNLCINPN